MTALRVLGPVRIEPGATVPLGRRRERGLLALLLLSANRVVPVQRLYDLLWDAEPPLSARHALHNHVASIRAALRDVPATVHSHGDAYELRVDADLVDAHRMRRLVATASTVDDPARRVALLDEALALWSGPPLSNAGGTRLHAAVVPALEELRLSAVEGLTAARLDLGDGDPGSELPGLAAAHPHRERLVELGMLALHRSGRTAEALGLFHAVRERLAADLGLDPGPRLMRAHREVVSGGATPTMSTMDGRADALAALDKHAAAGGPDEVALTMLVGAGASALARHWVGAAAHRFPDGRLVADAADGPAAALVAFLGTRGVPAPDGLDRAVALYREHTAALRLLVLLDGAVHPDQVRPLLPSGGGFVLVTAAEPLLGLVAVDGARLLRL